MKQQLKKLGFVYRPILRSVFGIFFDKRYLSGRWFEEGHQGYFWCLATIWQNRILRLGQSAPWPMGINVRISNSSNITFHPDDLNNFQSHGLYLQNFKGHIVLGHGTYLAPNVGIITANHDRNNLKQHEFGRDVVIHEECWIGMNSVILPGVILGRKTIVAAGSIVTKSFPEGNIIIAGNPATILKKF